MEGVIHKMWMPEDGGKDELQGGLSTLVVAEGPTLAQRKKFLCENADCFIILPGGPGTYDEMWEVISERQLALPKGKVPRPVVLVNVEGYWNPSLAQLQRCYNDGMLYKQPGEVVHSEATSAEALAWIVADVHRLRAEYSQLKAGVNPEQSSDGISDESRNTSSSKMKEHNKL